ncbi:MAG: hypothetical protein HQ539_00055 [Parcubacteria group bacterium]|nr:hypothetical protein [Parcubacteria group bacterium]
MFVLEDEDKKCLILIDCDNVLGEPLGLAALAMEICSILHLSPERLFNNIEKLKVFLRRGLRDKIGKHIESLNMLAPMEGAVEHILGLEKDGYECVLFTKRMNFLLRPAVSLLKNNKLGHMSVIGARDKMEALIQIMNDRKGVKIIVIDDNLQFIRAVAEMGDDNVHGIYFVSPYHNTRKELPEDAVSTWPEASSLARTKSP